MTVKLSEALRDVMVERERRVSAEGWTPAHDDTHINGQMARAAAAYAWSASLDDHDRKVADAKDSAGNQHWFHMTALRALWRWDRSWWKPKDRRRDLVRAGALIVAEIERLDRLRGRAALGDAS